MVFAKLRSPVILVHGLLGFDQICVAGQTLATYFPGVASALKEGGNRVHTACLSPTAGIECRAAELKRFIDRVSPLEPVHLIAHSLGGLDARYMISRLGMANRVQSLTTLGTPHRGTSFADWGIRVTEWIVRPTLELLQLPYQAFYDLTRDRCQRFNAEVTDAPEVRYFSVAGEHDGSILAPEWLLPFRVVQYAEGPNDGVVSVASARYGEDCEIWPGNHFSMLNWTAVRGQKNCETLPRWAKLVDRLRDIGF
jgi:triacylglycerol lipase